MASEDNLVPSVICGANGLGSLFNLSGDQLDLQTLNNQVQQLLRALQQLANQTQLLANGTRQSIEQIINNPGDLSVTSLDGNTETDLSQLFQDLGDAPYQPPLRAWVLFGTLNETLNYHSHAIMTVDGSSQQLTAFDALLASGDTVASGLPVVAAWNIVKRWYDVIGTRCG